MAYALDLDIEVPRFPALDDTPHETESSAVVLATEAAFPRVESAGGHDLITLDRLEALYVLRELATTTALS